MVVEASGPWEIAVDQHVDTPLLEPPFPAWVRPRFWARGRCPAARRGLGSRHPARTAAAAVAGRVPGGGWTELRPASPWASVRRVGTRLTLMGGGRMGEALVAGLLDAQWGEVADIAVVEKVEARRRELVARFPGLVVAADPQVSDGAVVAVKPDDVEAACRAVVATGTPLVLSIAAGVPLSSLEAWLGDGVRVVRAMPNTPALVGAGAAALAGGSTATADDLAWAEGLLSAVGTVARVPEHLLDAVTGLSGSGPAYVFLMAEALIDAGVLAGLPRATSSALVVQTLLGSARLLAESGQGPEALRAAVTSPGGTTAAGLQVLEERAVRAALIAAVQAAAERSRRLGGATS